MLREFRHQQHPPFGDRNDAPSLRLVFQAMGSHGLAAGSTVRDRMGPLVHRRFWLWWRRRAGTLNYARLISLTRILAKHYTQDGPVRVAWRGLSPISFVQPTLQPRWFFFCQSGTAPRGGGMRKAPRRGHPVMKGAEAPRTASSLGASPSALGSG